jgi:hypothetical protein
MIPLRERMIAASITISILQKYKGRKGSVLEDVRPTTLHMSAHACALAGVQGRTRISDISNQIT